MFNKCLRSEPEIWNVHNILLYSHKCDKMWFLTFYPPNRLPICRDGTSSNWNIIGRIQNSPCTPWIFTQVLANLPEQLPSSDSFFSRYGAFLSFTLDLDILEKTGDEIATLGEQLEGVFGWNAWKSGDSIIPILECGKVQTTICWRTGCLM